MKRLGLWMVLTVLVVGVLAGGLLVAGGRKGPRVGRPRPPEWERCTFRFHPSIPAVSHLLKRLRHSMRRGAGIRWKDASATWRSRS